MTGSGNPDSTCIPVSVYCMYDAYLSNIYNPVPGDVILTYSDSSLIEKLLLEAVVEKKKFKVIVSDGRVQFNGQCYYFIFLVNIFTFCHLQVQYRYLFALLS